MHKSHMAFQKSLLPVTTIDRVIRRTNRLLVTIKTNIFMRFFSLTFGHWFVAVKVFWQGISMNVFE